MLAVPYLAKYRYCDSLSNEFTTTCEIYGWCDRTDRFYIKYYDHFKGEYREVIAPFAKVTGWTWQSLSNHSKAQS